MGKSIRIFLVDGQPNGLLTAEIMNWTGKVIVAPRAQLAKLAERNDVRRTGTYLLVGPSPNVINRDCVYVGESDNVLSRIVDDHEKTKDFWVKAVLILSKDENLTKAHVRYLESRLIQMIQLSGRAELTNGTSPPLPLLPEADVSDMEYFLEQLKIILPVLGMNFTQPKPQITEEHDEEHEDISPVFTIKMGEVLGHAREVNSEFIVLKGSTARIKGVKSWDGYIKLRDQLVEEKKMVLSDNPELYVFAENVSFSSPSAAAACIMARNSNGRIEWKIEGTNTTYDEWYTSKLKMAGLED